MKKRFLIAALVCLILGFICFHKARQAILVYDENLVCEQELTQLNEKYGHLPYEIGQLKIQLGIVATGEGEIFIRNKND